MSTRRLALVGIASVAAIGCLRALALFSDMTPSGIDGGNWLAFGTFSRPGMTYPPLVPWLFALLTAAAGAPAATAIAGAAAVALPALAVLGVLSWAGRPVAGTMAALAIVSSRALGEMAAWGGYPQPTATGCAIVALVALAAWLTYGTRLSLTAFAVAFAAVVGTSHLVAVPTVGAVGVLLVGTWLSAPRVRWRRVVGAGALAVLPFAALAPTYIALFSTLGGAGAGQPGDAERVLGLGWPVYLATLCAVPLGAIRSARLREIPGAIEPRDMALLLAASAAAVSWLLAYVTSGEPRLLHDVAVLALFGAAALAPAVMQPLGAGSRSFAGAGAFLVVGVLTVAGLSAFPAQVGYYRVLTRDRFAALEWLRGNVTPGQRQVLVADVRGVPVGWWAEGMLGDEVLFASDLRWLRFDQERDRALSANTLLYAGDFPGTRSVAAVRAAGVGYVLLPSAGAFGIDPARPPAGWQVLFSSGDVVVLAPGAGG